MSLSDALRTPPQPKTIVEQWAATLSDEDAEAFNDALLNDDWRSVDLHKTLTRDFGLTAGLTAFKDHRRKVLDDQSL